VFGIDLAVSILDGPDVSEQRLTARFLTPLPVSRPASSHEAKSRGLSRGIECISASSQRFSI
jgi:hypothetical protein